MEKAYRFDFVHDTQSVFRQLLHAFSHPARQYSITGEADGFGGTWASMCAIGATLLDHEVSFYVEKTPELHKKLVDLTLARPESLAEAEYIFLTSPVNYVNFEQMLRTAQQGSLADPQESATVIIQCASLTGNAEINAEGPGICGKLKIKTSEYIKNIMQLRQTLNMEYPCGIDLLFVDASGEIMAFPRLCRVAE